MAIRQPVKIRVFAQLAPSSGIRVSNGDGTFSKSFNPTLTQVGTITCMWNMRFIMAKELTPNPVLHYEFNEWQTHKLNGKGPRS